MHRWWGKMSLLVAVVVTASACGSAAPAADLAPSTTASDPIGTLQRGLAALVAAGAPGAVVEVTDGDRHWTAAAGSAVRGGRRPAAVTDPVRIAGITTSMVAAVILQLVNEKVLTLDEPLDDVLPDTLPQPVTIRQLLAHTTGLPDYAAQLTPATVDGIVADAPTERTDGELVQAALGVPWAQTPGKSFSYSDTDYIVLGEVIEAIDGGSVGDSLQRRIFGPLGMNATYYPQLPTMPDTAMRGYLLAGGVYTDVTTYTPTYWSSAGAVVSTVGDVNRFFRALFSGRLVPRSLVAQMQQAPEIGSGLGVLASADVCSGGIDDLVFGQRGDEYGYRSLAFASPDGRRQVAMAWTGSSPTRTSDPLDGLADAVMTSALSMTCPA